MKKRSARPWLRYSKKDGSITEISMQSSPEICSGDGILHIDMDVALRFISGEINTHEYLVSLEDQILIERQYARYVRTHWFLIDVTSGSNMVEILEKNSDGIVVRRKDKSGSSMVIYVTLEKDPSVLISRHLLAPGTSKQSIGFDTGLPYSIYARQHVT